MEKSEIRKAMDEIERRIRERGYDKVESMIKTYHIGKETVVRLDDVLELIRSEKRKCREGTEKGYISETESEKISAYLALNHLQVVLMSGELCKANDFDEHKKILSEHTGKKPVQVPGRYAVGRKYDGDKDYWMFFVATEDDKPVFTNRPCMAKLYNSYKQAEACRDFLDDGDWDVVDMWEHLSADERLVRSIFGETDWDNENEKAVRLHFD